MKNRSTRRQFLQQTTAATAALAAGCQSSKNRTVVGAGPAILPAAARGSSLNIGVIGVANRGGRNLEAVADENIVALCDVDSRHLAEAAGAFPSARKFRDYRDLLGYGAVDAVVISTPDHSHAVIAADALRSGRHVYCEKPLAHTVSEARFLAKLAAGKRLATQLGTQIHASENYRRVVELIQTGAIGRVFEVHAWVGRVWTPQPRPVEIVPVPRHLDYDLWLGPATYRPYHPSYMPKTWRGWWHFGGGTLEDFGCHYLDLPFWALNLDRPTAIEPSGPPPHPEGPPPQMRVRYTFPGQAGQVPVVLQWHQGGLKPPQMERGEIPDWNNGVLFVGEGGLLLADYQRRVLLPENRFTGFEAPALYIPDSLGHHAEWIQACKQGGGTTCDFQYGGPLTETVLLGNAAYRTGRRLEWDADRMRAVNAPEARPFIHHEYRDGWRL